MTKKEVSDLYRNKLKQAQAERDPAPTSPFRVLAKPDWQPGFDTRVYTIVYCSEIIIEQAIR